MTKNEIVARWLEYTFINNNEVLYPDGYWALPENLWKAMSMDDYNVLHKAWVKFRDLNYPYSDTDNYRIWDWHRTVIANTITHDTITEAFDELVKGIEWVESLNKKV